MPKRARLEGQVSKLDVYAQDSSYVGTISEAIEVNYYNELFVSTNEDRMQTLQSMQDMYQTTLTNAESSLAQSQAVATQEIIIAITATSLIVLFVMLYTVRERTKEIGTLKAIGFSSGTIMNQFVLEGTLLSLVAGVIGIAIGSVAAPFLSSLLLPSVNLFGGRNTFVQPIQGGQVSIGAQGATTIAGDTTITTATVDPQLMLIAFGAAILLGVLGSLYPAWKAARIKPAEAMRYE